MTKVGNLKITNAILCDDIRSEINHKSILIGVYTGDILISNLPGTIPVAFYIEGKVEKPGDTDFAFKMSGPGDGEAVFDLKFTTTKENEDVVVPIRGMMVQMAKAGVFRLQASADKKKWTTLITKKVSQSDDLKNHPSTVSLPHFGQSQTDAQDSD